MLLFVMSLSSTILLIIWYLMTAVRQSSLDLGYARGFLLLCAVLYLLPFQIVKGWIPVSCLDPVKISNRTVVSISTNSEIEIQFINKSLWVPKWIKWMFLIWLILIFIFAVYQTIRYQVGMWKLLKDSVLWCESDGGTKLYRSRSLATPYTVGFFHPVIIFPDIDIPKDYFRLIYKHEYIHVKHHDPLVKLLLLGICCLHWFNPFVWFLLIAYDNLCEVIADENATEGLSRSERKEYCRMVLEMSEFNQDISRIWSSSFSSNKTAMKRRMKFIMKNEKRKLPHVAAAVMTALSLLLSACTVFAYTPISTTHTELSEGTVDFDMNITFDEDQLGENDVDEFDFSRSDEIIVLPDGTEIPVIHDSNGNHKLLCIHEYVNGSVKKHVKNNVGGCTIYLYKAQVCAKCAYVKSTTLVNTITYAVCTH